MEDLHQRVRIERPRVSVPPVQCQTPPPNLGRISRSRHSGGFPQFSMIQQPCDVQLEGGYDIIDPYFMRRMREMHFEVASDLPPQPSVLTFKSSNTLSSLVEDPENEPIIQSFHGTEKSGGDDTDSTGSFTPPISDSCSDTSLDGPDEEGHCNSWSVTGTSQLRLASVLQSSPSNGQNAPSASTYTSRRGKEPRLKMHTRPECKKKFPRPSALVTHMNSHPEAKRMGCLFPGFCMTLTLLDSTQVCSYELR